MIRNFSLTAAHWYHCNLNTKAISVPGRFIRHLACLVCVLCWTALAHAGGVVIVSSERSASYAAAADALVAELVREGVPSAEVSQRFASEPGGMDAAATSGPKLLVVLGTEALKQLLARDVRAPVLAVLIPRSGFERVVKDAGRKASANVTALYLDQPLGRQLDLIRLAIPDAKRVGVLWGAESVLQQPALLAAMQLRGLQEKSGLVVSNGGGVFSGLKGVLDDADVLLAVADPQVFNSATVSNILLATYRARIPVLAFSPAYVKAGALMSLHSTPVQIGTQAASVVRAILQGGGLPPAQYPTDFTVSVNEHVARSLGLNLDEITLSDKLRRMEKRP